LLPSALADYIIVHELCHRGQFDHSAAFWTLVARALPDYVTLRRRLRKTVIRFD
jgi:predicted metal-dependent hydrolase